MQNKKVTAKLPYIREEIYVGNRMLNFVISKIRNREYDKHILIIDVNALKDREKYFNSIIEELNVKEVIILRPFLKHKSFAECKRIIKKLLKNKI